MNHNLKLLKIILTLFAFVIIFLGCNKKTVKEESPTTNEIVPVVEIVDSDADGVPDFIDKSPGTPEGIAVDNYGRPFDSDYDGVPDFLDKDIMTPLGVKVDVQGVPLDSDKDGIPDYRDRHPTQSD